MGFNYNPNPMQMPQNQQVAAPQVPQMMGQSVQPLFPQPQGNVYNINSTLEVANVPVGAGMSIALCLPENVMYIKTMQNGNPLFYPYKIVPFTNTSASAPEETPAPAQQSEGININQLAEEVKNCNSKISSLEEQFSTFNQKNKRGDFNI